MTPVGLGEGKRSPAAQNGPRPRWALPSQQHCHGSAGSIPGFATTPKPGSPCCCIPASQPRSRARTFLPPACSTCFLSSVPSIIWNSDLPGGPCKGTRVSEAVLGPAVPAQPPGAQGPSDPALQPSPRWEWDSRNRSPAGQCSWIKGTTRAGETPNTSHVSQHHRMFGVGRDLCGSSSPTLLPKQGHLQQAAQDLVRAGLEYVQRRRLHSLLGQPVPVPCHPQRKEFFPYVFTDIFSLV